MAFRGKESYKAKFRYKLENGTLFLKLILIYFQHNFLTMLVFRPHKIL